MQKNKIKKIWPFDVDKNDMNEQKLDLEARILCTVVMYV